MSTVDPNAVRQLQELANQVNQLSQAMQAPAQANRAAPHLAVAPQPAQAPPFDMGELMEFLPIVMPLLLKQISKGDPVKAKKMAPFVTMVQNGMASGNFDVHQIAGAIEPMIAELDAETQTVARGALHFMKKQQAKGGARPPQQPAQQYQQPQQPQPQPQYQQPQSITVNAVIPPEVFARVDAIERQYAQRIDQIDARAGATGAQSLAALDEASKAAGEIAQLKATQLNTLSVVQRLAEGLGKVQLQLNDLTTDGAKLAAEVRQLKSDLGELEALGTEGNHAEQPHSPLNGAA